MKINKNLEELHGSIGDLKKLAILNLMNSIPLKKVPWEMIAKLASLRELIMGNSMRLENDEVNDPLLYSLKECPITSLQLYDCYLSMISGGVLSLPCLKHLSLNYTHISIHPDSLHQLHDLNTIELEYCDNIRSIPNLPGNVTSFKARNCYSLVNLPCNMPELISLTVLSFRECPELGTEDPRLLMKVTGLTNLTHLRMKECSVSQVPCEIGNLVSLKELDLSWNTFSSLPDSLSNLSQLLSLVIEGCQQLQLLPLLPSNLKAIHARWCGSLDVTSSASLRTKVCKESPFSNRLMIDLSYQDKFPEWCSYQNRGDVLSFVAPVHMDNICGIILCANIRKFRTACNTVIAIMYNKSKNTRHHFKTENTSRYPGARVLKNCMCVMAYLLDCTTLLVEPGDSMVLQLPPGLVSHCGLRLLYESDVVDRKLVTQTAADHTSDSHGQAYPCSDDEDYSSSDHEDYSSSDHEDELW